MIRHGLGTTKDEAKADEWDRRATDILRSRAEKGEAGAQAALASAYSSGQGVTASLEEAAKWLRKAAMQGDTEALNMLALRYDLGEGVKKDSVVAYILLLLAVRLSAGESNTTDLYSHNLTKVTQRLSAEQRARGDAAAKEWRPGQGLPETPND